MKSERAEVLVFGPDLVFLANLREILDRARLSRLPVVGPIRPAADLGAVVAYVADIDPIFRRAADYADKILRGAKPSDLPVEQVTRFELIVNLKAARALGLNISTALRLRANEIIE